MFILNLKYSSDKIILTPNSHDLFYEWDLSLLSKNTRFFRIKLLGNICGLCKTNTSKTV